MDIFQDLHEASQESIRCKRPARDTGRMKTEATS